MVPDNAQLDILVENMGRINFGPYLTDVKGITQVTQYFDETFQLNELMNWIQGVRLGQQFLFNWTIIAVPLKQSFLNVLDSMEFPHGVKNASVPTFYK